MTIRNTRRKRLLCGLALLPAAAFAQSVPLIQDSYVVGGSVINYGSATVLNVGGPGGDRALVQFDLSALPSGTTASGIAKATLILFVNKAGPAGTIDISVANGNWTESAVNGAGGAPIPAAAVASG